jgi:hypothetical protein
MPPAPRRCTLRCRIGFALLAAAARIAAVVPVMWNMRKIHFSHSCKTAVAEPSVKAARLLRAASAVGAQRRAFTDGAAEATRAKRARDAGSSTDPLFSVSVLSSPLDVIECG